MNLTEKAVLALCGKTKRQHVYDDAGGGFGVRIEAAAAGGRANYFWRAKVGGRVYYRSLGECGIVPLRQARENARRLAGQALDWKVGGFRPELDPFEKRKTTSASKPRTPTFLELREAYLVQHIRQHSHRPEQAEIRVLQLAKYLKDWNSRAIDSITVEDVLAIKNAQGSHRHTANRIVEFLRALFNWSARSTDGKINFWKVENPAKNVSRYKEAKRERFLLPEELAKFNEALGNEPDRDTRDFIVLSLATGARRSDVLRMRWQDLVWESRSWHIPQSKNGEGYDVALLPVAMETLKRRRAEVGSPETQDKALGGTRPPEKDSFVFPGDGHTGHLVDVKKRWQAFRKRAGVPDLRIHDLRRTCGSYLAMAGVGLPAVGQALGHKSLASTQIYARFDSSAVRAAREAGHRKMVGMMKAAKRRRKLLAR